MLEVHASSAIPHFATSIGGVLGGLISDTFGGEVLGFTVQIITIFVLFFILKLIIKPKDNNQIDKNQKHGHILNGTECKKSRSR